RENRFAAIRVDTNDGAQTTTDSALGPQSQYRAFLPAYVKADVRGVRFQRPALYLATIPGGKGPGVHAVDSATGEIAIVYDRNGAQRALLTRTAFNSSKAAEMLSLITADPRGRRFAALSRAYGCLQHYRFSP